MTTNIKYNNISNNKIFHIFINTASLESFFKSISIRACIVIINSHARAYINNTRAIVLPFYHKLYMHKKF